MRNICLLTFVAAMTLTAQQGGPVATGVVLSSAGDPSPFGQPLTLTATVTPLTATGSVTFYDGTTVLGTSLLNGGVASFTSTLPVSGVRSLTARYRGDSVDLGSTSPMLAQTVEATPANGFFTSPASYPGGTNLALADFNGDRIADLVVANSGGISILLGKGDGTFAPASPITAPGTSGFLATGDFNADGKTDLVVSSNIGVTVLLGKGDGTFQPGVVYGAGQIPEAVAVADFNADGRPDLVVTGGNSVIAVLLGNGDGTFQAAVYSAAPVHAYRVATADFNRDGKPDLAISIQYGSTAAAAVLLGNGDGTFQSATTFGAEGQEASPLTVADFNGDGNADLVFVTSSVVTIALGKGDGTFLPARSVFFGNINFVAAGDLNGDGKLDLAVAANYSGGVRGLLGNGDGTFGPAATYLVGSPSFVLTGELNGDGRTDLAVTDGLTTNILLGAEAVPSPVVLSSSPNPAVLGQPVTLTAALAPGTTGTVAFYNGTRQLGVSPVQAGTATLTSTLLDAGRPSLTAYYFGDLRFTSGTSQTLAEQVVTRPQDGFLATLDYPTVSNPLCVAIGDFNGDGNADLVIGGNGISVLLGNGDGTFRSGFTYGMGSSYSSLVVSDFNGDGNADIGLSADANTSFTVVLLGDGAGSFRAVTSAGISGSFLATADFNGDGKLDLVLGFSRGYQLAFGKGDGTFTDTGGYFGFEGGANSPITADFNRDGKADFALIGGNGINVFLGNGDGTFQNTPSAGGASAPMSLTTADFNGDGKADLAFGSQIYGTVGVLLGNGDGTFQIPGVYYSAAPDGSTYPSAGDFNGDGILDIVVVSRTQNPASGASNNVSVLLGNGDGTFQAPIHYSAGVGPVAVAVGDFNRDGRSDLAIANYDGNSVSVLPGRPSETRISTDSVSPQNSSGSSQVFTFTFSDTGSYQGLLNGNYHVLINADPNGIGACWVQLLSTGVSLAPDDPAQLWSFLPYNSNGAVQNSQCTVSGAGTTVSGSGSRLTLNLSLTFSSAFAGLRTLYTDVGTVYPYYAPVTGYTVTGH